jgi:hypothetical protein
MIHTLLTIEASSIKQKTSSTPITSILLDLTLESEKIVILFAFVRVLTAISTAILITVNSAEKIDMLLLSHYEKSAVLLLATSLMSIPTPTVKASV